MVPKPSFCDIYIYTYHLQKEYITVYLGPPLKYYAHPILSSIICPLILTHGLDFGLYSGCLACQVNLSLSLSVYANK